MPKVKNPVSKQAFWVEPKLIELAEQDAELLGTSRSAVFRSHLHIGRATKDAVDDLKDVHMFMAEFVAAAPAPKQAELMSIYSRLTRLLSAIADAFPKADEKSKRAKLNRVRRASEKSKDQ